MKLLVRVVLAAAFIGAGFGAGYVFRGKQPSPEIEDYALTNLLHDLGAVGYLQTNRIEDLRRLVDLRISDDLTRVRKNYGAISNAEFLESRMRTPSGVARLWQEAPPFQSSDMLAMKNQPWYPEWSSMQDANMKMIVAADSECRAKNCSPNYKGAPKKESDAIGKP